MNSKRRQAMLFPFLDVLLNGFNFILIIYYSWYLSQDGFGIFNALMALLAILFIVGTSLQTYSAKEIAKGERKNSKLRNKKRVVEIIIGMNAFLIIGHQWLMEMLRTDLSNILILILIFNLHIFLSYTRGIMQGNKDFLKLNISFYIEVLTKLILTLFLLPIFPSGSMALICLGLGMMFSVVYGAIYIFKRHNVQGSINETKQEVNKKEKRKSRGLVPVIIGNLFLFYITGINIMVVNRQIPESSHIYGMSTKFSVLIIAVVFSVITVLIPYVSKLVEDESAFEKFVRGWIIKIFCIGLTIVASYALFMGMVSDVLLNKEYSGLRDIVLMQSGAYVFLGLSQWLIAVAVVREEVYYLKYLIVTAILFTLLLVGVAKTIENVIFIEYLVHGSLCTLLMIKHFLRSDHNEKESYAIFIMERH